MNKDLYIFSISRADDAEEIHCLVEDAMCDDSLFSTDKDEIGEAAQERFAFLNHQAGGLQKPRWS